MKLLFLILLPFIELFLFIEVGAEIGALTTILLILLTGLAGWTVLKFRGPMALLADYRKMRHSSNPAHEMADSFIMMAGGLLLFVPGFLTDAAGVLCLFPPVRRHILLRLLPRVIWSATYKRTGGVNEPPGGERRKADDADVIEGEYRRR